MLLLLALCATLQTVQASGFDPFYNDAHCHSDSGSLAFVFFGDRWPHIGYFTYQEIQYITPRCSPGGAASCALGGGFRSESRPARADFWADVRLENRTFFMFWANCTLPSCEQLTGQAIKLENGVETIETLVCTRS